MTRATTTCIAIILACSHCFGAAAPVENDERKPNVLFISLDDMNDWLSCYASHPDAITPNIDRLAKRGVLFTNAYCVSPICGPSRAAVLTGMRPETTGVYTQKGTYIDYVPDAVTFPEHFRVNGYRAMAAGKINHDLGKPDPRLWDENGPDCGLLGTPFVGDELRTLAPGETVVVRRGPFRVTLPMNGGLSAIDRPDHTWNSFDWGPIDIPDDDFPDGKIAAWGVEQLQKDHDRPFLLAIGTYKPHQPMFAPKKYFDLYDPKNTSLPNTIAGDLHDVPEPGRDLATQVWTGTHRTVVEHNAWRDAVRAYLATVSFVDALVGRIVDGLDRGPHAENTWIILWSDHGWSLGEKEHWGKHSPWSESIRVPLIIVPPRNLASKYSGAGRECDVPVSLLDLYPTLIDMCGLSMRSELEGKSLLPLVADPGAEWTDAAVSTVGRGTHSVSTRDWRYIRYFDGDEELYDRREDPNEWFNLASDSSTRALRERLARHIPEDASLQRFVRWGRWKCVFPKQGDPVLYDYDARGGIAEETDLAAENPDVISRIRSYLSDQHIEDRRVNMPVTEGE